MSRNKVLVGLGGGGCCCFVIAAIIILATSFSKVDQTEWCLKYFWWSESVDEDPITEPGVVLVGMGNYLIRFPSTNLYCYFRQFEDSMTRSTQDSYNPPIKVRTSDGLAIQLELEFVYRLQQVNLRKLYMLVGGDASEETADYKTIMVNTALGVLDTFATSFSAQDFYSNREKVANVFHKELSAALSTLMYIDVQSFQLQPAHFPKEFADAIVLTQEKKQDIQVAAQEQQTKRIQQTTLLENTKALAQKKTIDAEAEAARIRLQAEAENSQYIFKQKLLAAGYREALAHFTANGAEAGGMQQFMQYLQLEALKAHNGTQKMIRLPQLSSLASTGNR